MSEAQRKDLCAYGHVTTKNSWTHRYQNFLTYGALLFVCSDVCLVGGKNFHPTKKTSLNFRNSCGDISSLACKTDVSLSNFGRFTTFKMLFSVVSTGFPELMMCVLSLKNRGKVCCIPFPTRSSKKFYFNGQIFVVFSWKLPKMKFGYYFFNLHKICRLYSYFPFLRNQ